MKLRLSYVGVNTDSFPRIQITDTGMQIMASNDSLRAAIHEAQQYLLGLQKIEREFASDSIVEQDRRIDKYLASKKKKSPDAVAGRFPCTDTESSANQIDSKPTV